MSGQSVPSLSATATADPGGPLALPERPRVLVITLRRLGDALLTTPLIRSIKAARPDAEIDVLVFGGVAGILKGNPDLHRIITMSARSSLSESLKTVAGLFRRYDLAISTQGGDRPTFLTALAGRKRIGIEPSGGSALGRWIKRRMLNGWVADRGDVHRVELMLRLADRLGIARDPAMVCPAAASETGVHGAYAVIHAAPMFRYKQWTAEGWRALASHLRASGLKVVAISGPDPAERAYVERVFGDGIEIRQPEWPVTVALLKGARVYVGPDTSTSHLAAAARCPTVVLFGPMDPRLWGPWPVGGLSRPWAMSGTIQNQGNVWIVQNPLPCMPCTLEGCERRIDSNSVCLDELSPARVIAAVDQALTAGNAWRA